MSGGMVMAVHQSVVKAVELADPFDQLVEEERINALTEVRFTWERHHHQDMFR